MNTPILYTFRRCPYAMRARLALRYAGVVVEMREVVLRDKPAALLMCSPKGTVPVLQLADGVVLEQSLDIMRWALAQSDPAGCLAAHSEEGDALIAINDGAFKKLLDRYKYPERHPESAATVYRDEAIILQIAPLNQRLMQTRYLLGDRISLADLAILPFVRQFAQVDANWFDDSPYCALRRWRDELIGSDLFMSVMDKLPQWHEGDAPYLA